MLLWVLHALYLDQSSVCAYSFWPSCTSVYIHSLRTRTCCQIPLQCPGHVVSVQKVLEIDVLFQEENEGGIQFRDQAAGRGLVSCVLSSHPLPPILYLTKGLYSLFPKWTDPSIFQCLGLCPFLTLECPSVLDKKFSSSSEMACGVRMPLLHLSLPSVLWDIPPA